MLFQSFVTLSTLALGTSATAITSRAVKVDQHTVYNLWSREVEPPKTNRQPFQGLELPFRRNGTWLDVGVWTYREDVLALEPFQFTLGPGRNNETYTVIDVSSGKKVAYSSGDLTLPVNYAVLAAFILTDEGNTKTQVVDNWTFEKDKFGRVLLGMGPSKPDDNSGLWLPGGTAWRGQNCAWSGGYCDGTYFLYCGACYGIPAVIELVEKKK